jgi:hypothetical protein
MRRGRSRADDRSRPFTADRSACACVSVCVWRSRQMPPSPSPGKAARDTHADRRRGEHGTGRATREPRDPRRPRVNAARATTMPLPTPGEPRSPVRRARDAHLDVLVELAKVIAKQLQLVTHDDATDRAEDGCARLRFRRTACKRSRGERRYERRWRQGGAVDGGWCRRVTARREGAPRTRTGTRPGDQQTARGEGERLGNALSRVTVARTRPRVVYPHTRSDGERPEGRPKFASFGRGGTQTKQGRPEEAAKRAK